jgi:hypothetical protein
MGTQKFNKFYKKELNRTFSLSSFLLPITAVICWSMNINMVARMAGKIARKTELSWFLPEKSGTSQGLSGLVGFESK